jgi:hypothetical protein
MSAKASAFGRIYDVFWDTPPYVGHISLTSPHLRVGTTHPSRIHREDVIDLLTFLNLSFTLKIKGTSLK